MASPATISQSLESLEQYEDVISWVNDTLAVSDDVSDASATETVDLTNLDHQIAQLLATLDVACEDTSAQLERTVDEVSRAVPRLTYDLHFMQDGALNLQTSLADVLQKSKDAVPDETSIALNKLRYLDTIKGRMEASREVLREAESWSTLEHEVTSLMSEHNYAKAAERLSEANKSVVVFQNTPEYDPRRSLMVNLQNQLEASLSSALVSAINSRDAAACKEYFSIFSIIQRESEFRNYFNASRRASIVSMWQTAHLTDCDSSERPSSEVHPQSFTEFLKSFYSSFAGVLNTERTTISSIFPDPAATISQFISSTLSSLQPTFSQRLSNLASHYGESSLVQLIQALQATEEFAVSVNDVMEKVMFVSTFPTERRMSGSEKTSGHIRRRSSRMSISWRQGQNTKGNLGTSLSEGVDGMDWNQELFQPFLNFQVDYPTLERRFLDQAMRDIITNDTREKIHDIDKPRLFRERAVDVFSVAEGSLNRCRLFTHGYGGVGLLQTVDGFFQSFIDMWRAEIQRESPKSSAFVQNSFSRADLSDLDYDTQDWSSIQLYLHLLASARVVFERITSFEVKLRVFLSQVANQFRLLQNAPNTFPIASSKGESQLLEQSTLNSAELHALLDSMDPELTNPREQGFITSPRLNQPFLSVDPLLLNSRQSLFLLAQACQTALQKTILSPLRNHLSSYASSPLWNAPGDPKKRTTSNDLQVPTFSIPPTETIQRVAEGLLNLPRLFEVYADDDALAFSLHTLPHVDAEMFKGQLEQSPDVLLQPTHWRRSSVVNVKASVIDPETVSSAWLLSLGQTFLDHLITQVIPEIPSLTIAGTAQMASDLDYISNIVRALNVEHEGLEKWKAYISMDDEAGRKVWAESKAVDPILRNVARMRGW